MTFYPFPAIVAHADWSSNPEKRWLAKAELSEGCRYAIDPPQKVGTLGTLFERLHEQAGPNNWILIGFDFPIGLPYVYARQIGIDDFIRLLPKLGAGRWQGFYEVAHTPEEINIYRPFYPHRPLGARRKYLMDALNVHSFDDLRRTCEKAYPGRRAASPLFWAVGGQQVGKAAISGWRDLLAPQRGRLGSSLSFWPFEGRLADLGLPGHIVVAETYPAEFYSHLNIAFSHASAGDRSGKRVQEDRSANATTLFNWAMQNFVVLSPQLSVEIRKGFGPSRYGEDRFDAVIGLLGMLNVIFGKRSEAWPKDESIRRIEGWILGQAPLPVV